MSVFRESIDFLVRLGIYDVVLPFILVFTIVFAILEKTKILGTEKDSKGVEYTKRNLNAMIAFVMSFLVVASTQLVSVINKTASQIFLVLLLVVCFLMLAGAFHAQSDKGFFLDSKAHPFYYSIFMIIVFVSIIMIFLNALGWLDIIYNFAKDNWNKSYIAAVIFIIVVIGFMSYVMQDPKKSAPEKKD